MNRDQGNKLWIDPVLTQLKLVRKSEERSESQSPREQIEGSALADRIGRIASEINEAAGYHLLETLYYLPPQKTTLSVRFDRDRAKHNMEIEVRDSATFLKFSTRKRSAWGWERYFPGAHLNRESTVVWEQMIQPGNVLDEHIQGWLTYLLSGLDKEFRPDQVSPSASESDLSAILRKASA